MKIQCKVCKKLKDESEYYKSNKYSCKVCHKAEMTEIKYKTPERMIEHVIFKNLKTISKKRKLKCEFKSHIDLIEYLKSKNMWNKFVSMYDKYIKSNRDRNIVPSILRINASKGYVRDNIKIDYLKKHIPIYKYENDELITFKSNFIKHVRYDKIMRCWSVIRTYKNRNKIYTWKSFLPSKDIATYYNKLIQDEILNHKKPITPEIKIKEWKELYPDQYQQRLKTHLARRKPNLEKRKDGYKFTIYDSNQKKGMHCYLPTKEAAYQHYYECYTRIIHGLKPIPIRKRDWSKMGLI